MKVKETILWFVFSGAFCSFGQSTQSVGNTEVTIDTLSSDFSIPWEIKLVGEDYLWVTERGGLVSRVNLQTGVKTVVLNLTGTVHAYGESGLLGMAFHPDFLNTTPEVFLVYTYGTEDSNGYFNERLVKYSFNGTNLVNEEILIDSILAWGAHDGSRLFVLPDNTLLMSTGECYVQPLAQDSTSLSGKYLRTNLDGSIPSDNPIPGSYVYTMGHRNSQGICALPNGRIIISEHGPTTDDELSVLEPGKNYGWPLIHGFCDEPFEDDPCATGLYQEPIHNWTPTIATSDILFYQNEFFPEWDHRVLMVTLNGQRLVAMELNGDESAVLDEDQYFLNQFGRLRDIAVGPDKEIYIATNTGNNGHPIIRITPPDFTGISEWEEGSVSLSPNPVQNEVKIHLKHDLPVDLKVFDVNGQLIKVYDQVVSNQTIDVSSFGSGTYILEITDGKGLESHQKLIKR